MIRFAQSQMGRSMVEMLGVLAIIGVLSVTGISGYTTAMSKYQANSILNELSQRAVHVSSQMMAENQSPTMDGFPANEKFDETVETNTDKTTFTIKVVGLEDRVALQIQQIVSTGTKWYSLSIPEDGSFNFTFNKDLSKRTTSE